MNGWTDVNKWPLFMATFHGGISGKRWRVFFWKLVIISVVNSWIVKYEVGHKVSLLAFMMSLTKQQITLNRSKTEMKRAIKKE